jgi:hypothetical protein
VAGAYIGAICSFLLLQGSDPGYILTEEKACHDFDLLFFADQDCREFQECSRCHVRRPKRAHHCRVCNKCVACFDHHCKILNTCIGERNHCRFLCFLTIHAVGLLLGLWISYHLSPEASASHSLASSFTVIGRVFACLLLLVVFPLFAQHCALAGCNSTSHECIRSDNFEAPYTRGCVENFFSFCFLRDGCCWACKKVAWQPTTRHPARLPGDRSFVSYMWENEYWSCC